MRECGVEAPRAALRGVLLVAKRERAPARRKGPGGRRLSGHRPGGCRAAGQARAQPPEVALQPVARLQGEEPAPAVPEQDVQRARHVVVERRRARRDHHQRLALAQPRADLVGGHDLATAQRLEVRVVRRDPRVHRRQSGRRLPARRAQAFRARAVALAVRGQKEAVEPVDRLLRVLALAQEGRERGRVGRRAGGQCVERGAGASAHRALHPRERILHPLLDGRVGGRAHGVGDAGHERVATLAGARAVLRERPDAQRLARVLARAGRVAPRRVQPGEPGERRRPSRMIRPVDRGVDGRRLRVVRPCLGGREDAALQPLGVGKVEQGDRRVVVHVPRAAPVDLRGAAEQLARLGVLSDLAKREREIVHHLGRLGVVRAQRGRALGEQPPQHRNGLRRAAEVDQRQGDVVLDGAQQIARPVRARDAPGAFKERQRVGRAVVLLQHQAERVERPADVDMLAAERALVLLQHLAVERLRLADAAQRRQRAGEVVARPRGCRRAAPAP